MARTKVVFLYTELAGYFLACADELAKSADVLIIRWPVNKEAPFDLLTKSDLKILDRKALDDSKLITIVRDFNPDILVCSGWIDKGYLKVAASFKKVIPVVMSLDNHWTGSLRQRMAALTSRFYLRPIFSHAWVPGDPQAVFAKKLGFGGNILYNYYCADSFLFEGIYQRTFSQKQNQFPHRFLYVARYVEHKGIFELWKAFSELKAELNTDWELWCIGTGDQWDNRMLHADIKHIGFVQPNELEKYIAETGVYILPSKFEPWGVSVQEFAVCGFPLLISDKVGSGTKFMNASNGFKFDSGVSDSIKSVMKMIIQKSDLELIEMGKQSHALGNTITVKGWVTNLLSVLKK